ncbi:galactose-3-O-sulfotransferase 4-like isoform X1 [Lingula anatina]|uniref:Galactose-3-O-sulfotransferase 4-like isoform X1 n=1 Tax=Lingula anatina TaxID=7574 RepID=A0A1S3HCL8_LINAN|nr:galactose-3-O-sulfotransferase 4-like isoform X1 [Lingula anatina]|eukprot:XP_013383763.1 galactose-3-O-sulfotransferase 4-like isoform X1 [Lingula anatina]
MMGKVKICVLCITSVVIVALYWGKSKISNRYAVNNKDSGKVTDRTNQGTNLPDGTYFSSVRQFPDDTSFAALLPYEVPGRTCSHDKCKQKRHIIFLKVHKCGSTTVYSILDRAAAKYGLAVLKPLPGRPSFYPSKDLNYPHLHVRKPTFADAAYSPNKTYDMMIHHMVFDAKVVNAMMPKDSFRIGIVREPFSQFKSAFNFMSMKSKFNITSSNSLLAFFQNPYKYWNMYIRRSYNSFIRNGMMYEFGFPDDDMKIRNNETFIEQYINYIDKQFDFIIVNELFDESLILLGRKLCWKVHDFLYVKRNAGKYTPEFKTEDDPWIIQQHKAWSKADYHLYDYFLTKMKKTIASQGKDFYDELASFKNALKWVKRCGFENAIDSCQRNVSGTYVALQCVKFGRSNKQN